MQIALVRGESQREEGLADALDDLVNELEMDNDSYCVMLTNHPLELAEALRSGDGP